MDEQVLVDPARPLHVRDRLADIRRLQARGRSGAPRSRSPAARVAPSGSEPLDSTTSPRVVIAIDRAARSILMFRMRTVTGPSANVSGTSRANGVASRLGPLMRTMASWSRMVDRTSLAPPETADSDADFRRGRRGGSARFPRPAPGSTRRCVISIARPQPQGERHALDPDGPAQELRQGALEAVAGEGGSVRAHGERRGHRETGEDQAGDGQANEPPAKARASHFFLRGIRHA